jgi:hypothetical protein
MRPGVWDTLAATALVVVGTEGNRRKMTCVVPSRYGVFSASRTNPPSVSASLSVATGGLAT